MDLQEAKKVKAVIDSKQPTPDERTVEIQEYFHLQVTVIINSLEIQYSNALHAARAEGHRLRSSAFSRMGDNGLMNPRDVIRIFNESERGISNEPSAIRELAASICNQAYAKTFLKYAK